MKILINLKYTYNHKREDYLSNIYGEYKKNMTIRDLLSILFQYPVYSQILITKDKLIITEENNETHEIKLKE